jgi:hypothetical protein
MRQRELRKVLRRAWLKDLMSGQFKQTKDMLYNRGRYCCLGVACKTYERVTGEKLGFKRGEVLADSVFTGGSAVRDAFGFGDACGGSVVIDDKAQSLAQHNDAGVKFQDIAKAMAKKWRIKLEELS